MIVFETMSCPPIHVWHPYAIRLPVFSRGQVVGLASGKSVVYLQVIFRQWPGLVWINTGKMG